MSTTDNDPQPGIGSDSEKIDRIAVYLDDQRQRQEGWAAKTAKATAYLALAAFFFGIGTLSDLRDRFNGPDQDRLTNERYVARIDASCRIAIRENPLTEAGWMTLPRAAAHGQRVAKARERMALSFNVKIPDSMPDKGRTELSSVFLYYSSADSFLLAAIGAAKAGDYHAYTVAIAHYKRSSAALARAAGESKIPSCAHYWNVAIALDT